MLICSRCGYNQFRKYGTRQLSNKTVQMYQCINCGYRTHKINNVISGICVCVHKSKGENEKEKDGMCGESKKNGMCK